MRTKTTLIYLLFVSLLYPALVYGHGEAKHDDKGSETKQVVPSDENAFVYEAINSEYVKSIKPIFEKKCFDCHSDATVFPWYYKLPGVKQMMESDIKEAKKHVDMSRDFPFISHETPLNDLKSLKKIGLEGGMPPLRYIIGHWDSRLSDAENARIVKWAEDAIKLLKGGRDE